MVPPSTDDTHIRVSKRVANKFKEIGTYNETEDNILKSLIDFYVEHRGKKAIGDRKKKNNNTS
jgi:hypothetical protein